MAFSALLSIGNDDWGAIGTMDAEDAVKQPGLFDASSIFQLFLGGGGTRIKKRLQLIQAHPESLWLD